MDSLIIRNNILKEECEFPKLFASCSEKAYGLLFFNENNKDSHDSNHAILFPDKIVNIRDVLSDITKFYLKKSITPRIYQPYVRGYLTKHMREFKNSGYEIEMYGESKFMLLSDENKINSSARLEIKRIIQ